MEGSHARQTTLTCDRAHDKEKYKLRTGVETNTAAGKPNSCEKERTTPRRLGTRRQQKSICAHFVQNNVLIHPPAGHLGRRQKSTNIQPNHQVLSPQTFFDMRYMRFRIVHLSTFRFKLYSYSHRIQIKSKQIKSSFLVSLSKLTSRIVRLLMQFSHR